MDLNNAQRSSNVVHWILMVVIPASCVLVAWIGLASGSAVVVRCDRRAQRVTEEAMETRGIVTVPVERIVQQGRVDVTVRRKILGILTWKRDLLADVVEADSS